MSDDMLTAVNLYGFYRIPTSYKAKVVPGALLAGKIYEPRTIQLIRNWAGDGNVISGGAFIGDFFPAVSRAIAPGRRLISFEPNPTSHAAARETIALNRLENVTLEPVAVGESEGQIFLLVQRDTGPTAAQAQVVEHEIAGKTVTVPVRTLDSLVDLNEPVSVLHLDLEGYELPALKGANQIIAKHRPLIILEGFEPDIISSYLDAMNEITGDPVYRHCGSMERNSFFLPR